MLTKSMPRLSIGGQRRFWSKVDVREKDECWPWMAHKVEKGYGQFSIGHELFCAHRISYFLAFGAIPSGLLVCHHCDNPACINPSHLFVGTHKDNTADMINKGRRIQGRMPSGEDHHKTKLSIEEVIKIEIDRGVFGDTVQELSRGYKVSTQIIHRVLNREYCTDV